MVQALALAVSILAILEYMRAIAECVYAVLFAVVTTLCSNIHVELAKPLLSKRQPDYYMQHTCKKAETYFSVSIFRLFHLLIASVNN